MKLHYRKLGVGEPMMILHGLFGFSDNWQSHAKKLAEYYCVILVDLRNHGHSPWSEEFSYEIMAQDIFELCQDLNIKGLILMGHSMGGKVAMKFAQNHPEVLKKLVIIDIGIKEYPMHHKQVLLGIHSVDLENISLRRQAEEQISSYIASEGFKQFLLKNLYWKEKGKLAWRMNVRVIEREMEGILSAIDQIGVNIPTLFIRGEKSNYILDKDIQLLEDLFIDSEVVTISNAGHWVHVEATDEFQQSLLSFCLI